MRAFFFLKEKTANDIEYGLVGSEMCIRDRTNGQGIPDFYAFRSIAKDEEIRYDYAMTEYRHYERSRPELDFDLTCHCGSPICRGRFGYYSELSAALKEAYRGFISDYLIRSDGAGVTVVATPVAVME